MIVMASLQTYVLANERIACLHARQPFWSSSQVLGKSIGALLLLRLI